MKGNWEQTQYNQKVAIKNYYSKSSEQMAQITISQPYAGVLATFWCPVQHKDKVAERALKLAEELKSLVLVSHPLPDVEDAGQPLFERYVFHSWK